MTYSFDDDRSECADNPDLVKELVNLWYGDSLLVNETATAGAQGHVLLRPWPTAKTPGIARMPHIRRSNRDG